MTASARHPQQFLKPCPAIRVVKVIMAVDKPAATRHLNERAFQNGVIARIRDQPMMRKGD